MRKYIKEIGGNECEKYDRIRDTVGMGQTQNLCTYLLLIKSMSCIFFWDSQGLKSHLWLKNHDFSLSLQMPNMYLKEMHI